MNSKNIRRLTIFLFAAYASWTIWCALMIWSPTPFGDPLVRAVARIFIVALPAILFVLIVEKAPLIETLKLSTNIGYGILCGMLAGMLIGAIGLYQLLQHRPFAWSSPTGLTIWLNWIIGSPLAEEILFRGVVFRVLKQEMNVIQAAFTSAICFSLIHAPWWIISREKQGLELALGLTTMLGYGLCFAFLFQITRSLWAPLVAHWINNWVAITLATGN